MATPKPKAPFDVDKLYICKSVTTGLPWGHNGPEPGQKGYTPRIVEPPPVKKVSRLKVVYP